MEIAKNEQLVLLANGDEVLLKCVAPFDLKSFSLLLETFPRVQITDFPALKDCLLRASGEPVAIGCLKPEIEVTITNDEMSAFITLHLTDQEYTLRKAELSSQILSELEKKRVCFGIKEEVINQPIPPREKVLIAEGIHPAPGEDAKCSYFQPSEKKPQLKSDGGVDHFDIQLIDLVHEGDWLGEKHPPTSGHEGTTVTNCVVLAKAGRDVPLRFDSNSVEERTQNDGKTILRAKVTGAVTFKQQRICVDNHLMIEGDVDYSTGNIDFDGYITIQGSVADCFAVRATKDIAIMGEIGIGAVELIESREGDISIKGGINGKGSGSIKAKNNVFVKYANECVIEAGGTVVVGLYVYNSDIKADKVIIEGNKGKLIGGQTVAKYQVISPSIGNQYETPTDVKVVGFSRADIKQEIENLKIYFQNLIQQANKNKRQLDIFTLNYNKLDDSAIATYHVMQHDYDKMIAQIAEIKGTIEAMQDVLLTKGDGEIKILREIYPKSSIKIKDFSRHISDTVNGSFYVKDNQLYYTQE